MRNFLGRCILSGLLGGQAFAQSAPVQSAPVQSAPVQSAPGQSASGQSASARFGSVLASGHAGGRALAPAQVESVVWSGKSSGTRVDTTPELGAEAACEVSLRLPWGPITTCREAVIAGAVGATAAVSLLAWWNQGFSTRFNVANEGWFGHDTYAGGIDKLGHAYSFYVGTRLGTRALGWAQVPRREALQLAAGVGLGVGLGIEVLDGLSRSGEYGFSWQDMAMNVVGVGTAMLMESNPGLDRRIAFRWMYRAGGEEWYDGHIYLVAFRLSGLSAVGRNTPLRFVELVAGYGASGFRSDFDFSAGDTRRRTAYLGIGIDLSELLNGSTFAGNRSSRAQRWTEETLRYVQVPGTVAAKRWDRRP